MWIDYHCFSKVPNCVKLYGQDFGQAMKRSKSDETLGV